MSKASIAGMSTELLNLSITVLDPEREMAAASFEGSAGIAFSPDGESIATAVGESVLLYDVPSFVGRRLVSASEEGTMTIWDTELWQEVLTVSAHAGPITGVAFSPNGRWIASVGIDGRVRLWDGSPATLAMDSRNL